MLHVLRYWWVIGFTSLLAIVDTGSNVLKLDIPWWVWLVVVLLSAHIAQFLAWNDMRNERDRFRRLQITDTTLTKIAEYRRQQIKMQNEAVSNEQELGAWWQRYETLRMEIIEYLRTNVSEAESLLFANIGTFEIVFRPQDDKAWSPCHVHRRSWIARDHRWLETFAVDYGRKRPRSAEGGDTSESRQAPEPK